MSDFIDIQPDIIRWAVHRSGLSEEVLRDWNKGIIFLWEKGEKKPTLRLLTDFAQKVHVPLGYLFLEKPPEEKIPVPDYRTFDDNQPQDQSPDLIDTLYEMQRRQDWMRDYLIESGAEKLPFIGSLKKNISVEDAALKIRNDIGLTENWVAQCPNYEESFRKLRNTIDETGILISVKGCVGMNYHRHLNPDEFCGFVLMDNYAPLIFINSQCPKSAQIFTLIHELAHLWIGESGVFNHTIEQISFQKQIEKQCNQIAAEFLVPKNLFKQQWNHNPDFETLAKKFKVSSIVIARRALDLNLIGEDDFFTFWYQQKKRWEEQKETKNDQKNSGNFYQNCRVGLGKRFSEAVISAARSGFLSYKEAFRLTGLQGATFDHYVSFLKGGKLD
jgi:Zn-dependent peptidase ImmA (M78 family)